MPLIENLDADYTPAQLADIETALDNVITIIQSVYTGNITADERDTIRSMAEGRYPYAANAIGNLGPQFTNLISREITLTRAAKNFNAYQQNGQINTKVQRILDLITDFNSNAGWVCMKFTDDLYSEAERYKGRNVQGADVVYDALKPLYERERAPQPPTP